MYNCATIGSCGHAGKTLSAFSKINDCRTIESCPIAPKSPGEAQKTFADQREQRQVCHEPEGIVVVFVVQKHKLASFKTVV